MPPQRRGSAATVPRQRRGGGKGRRRDVRSHIVKVGGRDGAVRSANRDAIRDATRGVARGANREATRGPKRGASRGAIRGANREVIRDALRTGALTVVSGPRWAAGREAPRGCGRGAGSLRGCGGGARVGWGRPSTTRGAIRNGARRCSSGVTREALFERRDPQWRDSRGAIRNGAKCRGRAPGLPLGRGKAAQSVSV